MPETHLHALPAGHRIDEYEIVRVLGAGGFSITYLAFDHKLDGPVALMEYFPAGLSAWSTSEGESLAVVLERRHRLTPDQWRPWLEALLDGLAHMHDQGYLHRDVNPRNIVVRSADRAPVLIDFGAARVTAAARTHTQVLSPDYAPIEQHSGKAAQGPFTDIYALAAVS